ncbi:G-PROTEIN-RECEP-F1-2 domain-containing protein [Aphelenchoides fujianensis]|nr:G-PROTEIN-RECEP-F1-2 domain-containing protein [Aphelenchoides fujianensis]
MLLLLNPTAFPQPPLDLEPSITSGELPATTTADSLLERAVKAGGLVDDTALDLDRDFQLQWQYLLLIIVPIACIAGNVLVVLAVWTTKSLQTPTNYLLVSLACADLLIGALVMPFSIYVSINDLHFHLPMIFCHFYCLMDVSASTASIVHLVLISIDRLVAATKPAEYKTMKHRKRVYYSIGFAWAFMTSGNTNMRHFLRTEHRCGINNPMYMLYSSIFAFFLPCLVMSMTYGFIFYTLKKRLRAIKLQELAGGKFLGFGGDVANIASSAFETVIGVEPKNRHMLTWEKPLLRKIEETAAEHASSLNDSEREQIQNLLDAVQPSSSDSRELTTFDEYPDRPPSVVLEAVTLRQQQFETSTCATTSTLALEVPTVTSKILKNRRFSETIQTTLMNAKRRKSVTIETVETVTKRRLSFQPAHVHSTGLKPPSQRKSMRRLSEIITEWERPSRSSLGQLYSFARRESVYIARKKLAGLKDWALDLLAKLKSRQGMAIRREHRATKLVSTVMGVFLICWLPFFTLNMVKVYYLVQAGSWPDYMEELFHWCSALGYLNSSLNFAVYAAINKKFRTSFRRLLGLKRAHRDRTWMLPPREDKRRSRYSCGCKPFNRTKKSTLQKASSVGMISRILSRRLSVNKPEIVIDEVSIFEPGISISAGGNTTFRRSSDDCIRRSSSEVIGVVFPSNYESRRGSQMSNSSASLQLHDMHQISEMSMQEAEIFV